MLGQGLASGVGHAVAFFPAFGVAGNQFAFFKKRQGRVDHAGTGTVGAVEHAFDLADQVVAVARLFGDQRQQQQFQVAGGKYSRATPTAFAARAFLEAIATVAEFAVGGMMVSHFLRSLSSCLDTT
ncbi:hypothetical protein D9M72_609360 [compost metagenome]